MTAYIYDSPPPSKGITYGMIPSHAFLVVCGKSLSEP